jgi:hypothetical protein
MCILRDLSPKCGHQPLTHVFKCGDVRHGRPCTGNERKPPITLPEDCLVCEVEDNVEKADSEFVRASRKADSLGQYLEAVFHIAEDVRIQYEDVRSKNQHQDDVSAVREAETQLGVARVRAETAQLQAAAASIAADAAQHRAELAQEQIGLARELASIRHSDDEHRFTQRKAEVEQLHTGLARGQTSELQHNDEEHL